MATSSIFSNVKITDAKQAEAFVHALELSESTAAEKSSAKNAPTLTDLQAIRKLMAKKGLKK